MNKPRPTLGQLRSKRPSPPYRPRPAIPAPIGRPTLDALRRNGAGVAAAAAERVEAFQWLAWSLAVDVARALDQCAASGWDRDDAADVIRQVLVELVDDAVAFGVGWAEITAP